MTTTVDATELAIPWTYTDEAGMVQWSWVTEHLAARIVAVVSADASGNRVIRYYHWELADRMRLNQGMPRLLIEGDASSFDEAESLVREHVGKCYDPRLGYRRYAGSHAFTFELSSGERKDVSGLIGSEVTITVVASDGSTHSWRGDFDVSGYRWRLRTSERVFDITPEHVVSITDRSAHAAEAARITHPDSYSGVGRIYREDFRAGCTGRPGFLPQTVDHAGATRCPIHESTLPDHLLH